MKSEQHDDRQWWRGAVIYQVYSPSFQDASGDGFGDLRGITERLPYLEWLGVDAVWITPFYASPMVDFGYDISDHTDVAPVFGDLDDFDTMLAQAHRRKIRVLVDFVPNHTSDQHPWFVGSRSATDHPQRDWYVWADPTPDGAPPNNWLSVFGGSAWTLDHETGQYYLHSFLPEQPDLNWRNPAVANAMLDVLRFWLDRGVDGIRVDAASYVMKDPGLRDNPVKPVGRAPAYRGLGDYDSQVHLHSKGHSDLHQVYRRIRETLDEYPPRGTRIAVGEVHFFDWPDWITHWAKCYGAAQDELQMPLNLTMVAQPWDAKGFQATVERTEQALPEGAWPNVMLGGHDYIRVASRFGVEQARLAMTMLLTLRGSPIIYYGDEIGMRNVDIPQELRRDPWGKRVPNAGLDRDSERTPMRWDESANAGFCAVESTPWLPVGDDIDSTNVAAQRRDPSSLLTLTRLLIDCRRRYPALRIGDYRSVDDMPEDCYSYLREHGSERVLVVLNFAAEPRKVALLWRIAAVLASCSPGFTEDAVGGCTLALPPLEGVVVLLE